MLSLVFWTLLGSAISNVPSTEATPYYEWQVDTSKHEHSDRALRGHTLRDVQGVKLLPLCARFCLDDRHCQSLNFNPSAELCELNNVTHIEAPNDIRQETGSEYYPRSSFNVDPVSATPILLSLSGRYHELVPTL